MRKNGNISMNLSVHPLIGRAVKTFVFENKRKGRATVSELTEQLWLSYLRKKGAKLPVLMKKGVSA